MVFHTPFGMTAPPESQCKCPECTNRMMDYQYFCYKCHQNGCTESQAGC